MREIPSVKSILQALALMLSSRAPLSTKQTLPPNFGDVCGMAMTQTPFIDQAIVVSTGTSVQASILDFRSKEVEVIYFSSRIS